MSACVRPQLTARGRPALRPPSPHSHRDDTHGVSLLLPCPGALSDFSGVIREKDLSMCPLSSPFLPRMFTVDTPVLCVQNLELMTVKTHSSAIAQALSCALNTGSVPTSTWLLLFPTEAVTAASPLSHSLPHISRSAYVRGPGARVSLSPKGEQHCTAT